MEFPWMYSCITTRKGKLNIRVQLLHSALCCTNFSMLNILQCQRIQEDSSYCPKRGKWSYNTDHCQSAGKCKGHFTSGRKATIGYVYGSCPLTKVFPTPFSDGGVAVQVPQFCWAFPIMHRNGSHYQNVKETHALKCLCTTQFLIKEYVKYTKLTLAQNIFHISKTIMHFFC